MSFFVQWIYLLSLAIWVGAIVFFSFFTTPTIFANLPKEMAGELLSALFPRYYLVGYAAGTLLLTMTLVEALLVRHMPWIRFVIVAVMLSSTFYAGLVVRPQVHNLKIQLKAVEEGSELAIHLKSKFDGLHRLSVVLNMVVLVGGLLLVGLVAFRLRL